MRLRLVDERTGYGVVLVLIGVTYAVSVSTEKGAGAYLVLLVQLLALRMVLLVSHARRSVRRIVDAIALAVGVVVVAALVFGQSVHPHSPFTRFVLLGSAVLYGIAPLSIIRDVIGRPTVDEQTLLAAIAAYLMIGMFFAFTYRFLGDVGSIPFFGTTGRDTMANDLFFSFVTLTTTGYGNLVPAANPGQSLAVLEAIAGQLFLVTAVAKVVNESGLLSRRRRSALADDDEASRPG